VFPRRATGKRFDEVGRRDQPRAVWEDHDGAVGAEAGAFAQDAADRIAVGV
jgi:hypothetical protein